MLQKKIIVKQLYSLLQHPPLVDSRCLGHLKFMCSSCRGETIRLLVPALWPGTSVQAAGSESHAIPAFFSSSQGHSVMLPDFPVLYLSCPFLKYLS